MLTRLQANVTITINQRLLRERCKCNLEAISQPELMENYLQVGQSLENDKDVKRIDIKCII